MARRFSVDGNVRYAPQSMTSNEPKIDITILEWYYKFECFFSLSTKVSSFENIVGVQDIVDGVSISCTSPVIIVRRDCNLKASIFNVRMPTSCVVRNVIIMYYSGYLSIGLIPLAIIYSILVVW